MKFKYKLRELLDAYELTWVAVSQATGINRVVLIRIGNQAQSRIDAHICHKLMKFFRLERLDELVEIIPDEAVELPTKRREAERELIAA